MLDIRVSQSMAFMNIAQPVRASRIDGPAVHFSVEIGADRTLTSSPQAISSPGGLPVAPARG